MSMDLDHESGEGCSNLNPSTVPVNMDESSSVPPPQPPTPPSPPKTIGSGNNKHEILQEFNLADYIFQSKIDMTDFPVLCDPSKSKETCRYYALSDVCNTRRIILEATLPPENTTYFNNCCQDKIAVQQLIENNPGNLTELLKEMQSNGVTSEMHFNKTIEEEKEKEEKEKEKEEKDDDDDDDEDDDEDEDEDEEDEEEEEDEVGRKERRFKGCPKFKIHSWFKMRRQQVNVSVADIENEFLPETEEILPTNLRLATTEIRHFGPIIGEYSCTEDNNMICKQAIYDQTINPKPKLYKDGPRIGHAIMLIGYGIAKKLSTGEKVPYYVFQNNWGSRRKYIGRILTSLIKLGYVPCFDDQCDLVDFMAKFGNDSIHLCKSNR